MALVHRVKVSHYFSPSPLHLDCLFNSMKSLYAEQQHTDLVLVTKKDNEKIDKMQQSEETNEDETKHQENAIFGAHQMIFASCSKFIRDLILKTTDGCTCDTLTIFLPDFNSTTVKNLISLLYTGYCIGDCSFNELKLLIKTLKIDICDLPKKSERKLNESFPNVELPSADSNETSNPIPNQRVNFSSRNNSHNDDSTNDEMVEVTPEVQMFFGNHFLAGENGSESDLDSTKSSTPRTKSKSVEGETASSLIEQSMARHKELVRSKYHQMENGLNDSTISNGMGNYGNRLSMSGESSGDDRTFTCRLCGKISGNSASLFAHLLYPHYAHLWREEIPHRAQKYDCKKCNYTTNKRQHFVMHVARVHDELRKKLAALGENLEVLDNLSQKAPSSSNTERIVSTIAKGIEDSSLSNTNDLDLNDPGLTNAGRVESSPNAKEMFAGFARSDIALDDPKLTMALPNETVSRYPRGYKPYVKCRLCGKVWKGKDNFFTHLVSTHFKYLWAKEVPRSADMFHCHVQGCNYQSKYRYNFLFHLAGKHKQLKQKLSEEGIPHNVLVPIETDASEMGDSHGHDGPGSLLSGLNSNNPAEILRQSKMILQNHQHLMTTPPAALKSAHKSPGRPNSNNTRLICRVCSKVSLNHTCHRQHVVGKHFHEFWSNLAADAMGIFNCHHPDCSYKTPNRSVFIIHLAYVHQELKTKLIASGKDPNCATPDVYGKRKYRRQYYDNTQHSIPNNLMFAGGSPSGGSGGEGSPSSSRNDNLQMNASSYEDMGDTTGGAETLYSCNVCKSEFSLYGDIIEHLALSHFHHVWDDSSSVSMFSVPFEGPYACQSCSYVGPERQLFISHLVTEHDVMKHVMAIQFNGEKTIDDLIQVLNESSGQGGSHEEEEEEDLEDDVDEDDVMDDEDMPEEDDLSMVNHSLTSHSQQANDSNIASW